MKLDNIKVGMGVKTIPNLRKDTSMALSIKLDFLVARQGGVEGVVKGYFMAMGGDVWAVEHADGSVGAYSYSEFDPA